MKTLLLSALLMWAGAAVAYDACQTGSYYDPNRSGEGISLEVLDGRLIGYFYTYRGSSWAWYTMVDGTLYATLRTSAEPFEAVSYDVGSAEVAFTSDDSLTFKYHFDLDVRRSVDGIPWCLANCNGERSYIRLTQPVGCG